MLIKTKLVVFVLMFLLIIGYNGYNDIEQKRIIGELEERVKKLENEHDRFNYVTEENRFYINKLQSTSQDLIITTQYVNSKATDDSIFALWPFKEEAIKRVLEKAEFKLYK